MSLLASADSIPAELLPMEINDGQRIRGFPSRRLGQVTFMNEAHSGLPKSRFQRLDDDGNKVPHPDQLECLLINQQKLIFEGIVPWYVPEHKAVLAATHVLQAPDT